MKNLIVRTISGIGFIAVMAGSILWCKYSFFVLLLVIMSMMMYEFLRMTMGKDYLFSQMLSVFAAAILFSLTFAYKGFGLHGRFVILAFVPVFVIMIHSLYVKDKAEFGKFANLYTALLYIAVPVSVSNFLVFHGGEYSGQTLLMFFIIIWGSDVGAYLFGISLGKIFSRKLFPSISPHKSWVGFWGGFIVSLAIGAGLQYFGFLHLSMIEALGLAVILDISGVYGDLIESQWKRHYGIKDSGTGIPGHGGFLDRFDSSLTAIPMGTVYLMILNVF